MIGGIVTYLGTQLSKNKDLKALISDIGGSASKWLRSVLFKDNGEEKEVSKMLREKPNSKARQKAVKSMMEVHIEDFPEAKKHIERIFYILSNKEKSTMVRSSKNVNTGIIKSGRDTRIGDN
ncbi:MAG: hypothetical protein CMI36_02560 [Owenweeksia sp.]|nr:hypothetical protein [Owenweeksia sp.]MBF97848.1 hypothetical protein [Owenweeksia sp.]